MTKKYSIIFDSNILYEVPNNFLDFSLSDEFKHFVEWKKKYNVSEVDLYFPDIVFKEMLKQQEDYFNFKINQLNSFKGLFEGISEVNILIEKKDYTECLAKKADQIIIKYGVNILHQPINEKVLNGLISRVIAKKKPFYKKLNKKDFKNKKANDSGFKDSLIWESIIEFSKKKGNELIFISEDGDLTKKELQEEFTERTGGNIKIYTDMPALKAFLEEEYGLEENIKKFYNSINENFFRSIEYSLNAEVDRVDLVHEITDLEDIYLGRRINDITCVDGTYEISVDVEIMSTLYSDSPYEGYEQIDPIYANYSSPESFSFRTHDVLMFKALIKERQLKVDDLVLKSGNKLLRYNGSSNIGFNIPFKIK